MPEWSTVDHYIVDNVFGHIEHKNKNIYKKRDHHRHEYSGSIVYKRASFSDKIPNRFGTSFTVGDQTYMR